jgi:O-acetyl-ADP-ribose deacetylase
MEKTIGSTRVRLELTDITKLATDAIVNAANPHLAGGGGVDGAIHRAGGHSIGRECAAIIERIGRLAPGKAVITGGGRLPAKHVIHTVGPIWRGGSSREAEILASAYRESLALADKMALASVAFPSISTGVYGYPTEAAAAVALAAVSEYLSGPTGLTEVVFALFSREDLEIYSAALAKTRI